MTSQDPAPPVVDAARRTPVLVGLGRAALVGAALLWLAVALFGPDDLRDASGTFVKAYVGAVTLLALLGPWLLLPVGSSAHATYDDDGVLSVVTVLGVQHVDLGDLRRVGAVRFYWRAGYDQYLYLRGPGPRVAWVMLDGTRSLSGAALARLVRTVRERPGIATARARAVLRIEPAPGPAQRYAQGLLTGVIAFPLFALWTWVVLATFLIVPL